jgi:NAD(P)H dehydrogenase (quinone)
MVSKKMVILYYSGSGHTQKMADAIAEAARSSTINVTVESVERFDPSLLPKYDGIVIGSPTYFSNMAWQIKKMVDESIMHYGGGKLKKKVAGIFTSCGSKKDGKDCLKMLEVAFGYHHGMKIIEGIIRVDGERDEAVQKRCREYGKKLAEEILRK